MEKCVLSDRTNVVILGSGLTCWNLTVLHKDFSHDMNKSNKIINNSTSFYLNVWLKTCGFDFYTFENVCVNKI